MGWLHESAASGGAAAGKSRTSAAQDCFEGEGAASASCWACFDGEGAASASC